MLLKIKDDDDRAMDAVEEKVHKEYQKKLLKKDLTYVKIVKN